MRQTSKRIEDIERFLLTPTSKILEVLSVIGQLGGKTAFVVDANRKLLGAVTDGDIRRGFLKGVQLTDPVSEVMNSSPVTGNDWESDIDHLLKMKEAWVHHLPILNVEGCVIALKFFNPPDTRPVSIRNPVLIMAGGKGARLGSLTENTPKPLLKVGGKPVLETIIDQLKEESFANIYISLHHMGEKIKNHFEDGSKLEVKIDYLEEQQGLGTAGSLGMLPKKLDAPVLVMNGDILTSMSFRSLVDFHIDRRADLTIALKELEYQLPYGVVNLSNEIVDSIDEKPTLNYLVNTGIYVVNPGAIDLIGDGESLDMTNLIRRVMERRMTVCGYRFSDYWVDIGKKTDFERANIEFLKMFQLFEN